MVKRMDGTEMQPHSAGSGTSRSLARAEMQPERRLSLGLQAEILAEASQAAMNFPPGRHSFCGRARAALIKPKALVSVVGVAAASYVVLQSVYAVLGESPGTTAVRLMASTCALLMDASLWLRVDPHVLAILAPRARYMRIMQDGFGFHASSLGRVLYFIGAVCFNEGLFVAMRWNKAEPVSTVLAAVASIGSWSLIPLLDAIPQHIIGPTVPR